MDLRTPPFAALPAPPAGPRVARGRARGRRVSARLCAAIAILVAAVSIGSSAASASPRTEWEWPLEGFRLEQPYVAPAHAFGPGHRGIDLRPWASIDVRAPAPGIVAFAGDVAGRGIVTIDHGGGLVTTFEPVASSVGPGAEVAAGEVVGVVDLGGHAAAGALHVGVRLDGEYINPLLLLGGVPRAVLLPCCDPLGG